MTKAYKHLLLTTDCNETSHKCIEKGLDLAKLYGAKLTILHVVEPLPAYAMSYMGSVNLEEEMIAQAKISLEKLVADHHLDDALLHIELGSVKACILTHAKEHKVDLIIIGSHGRHGLERLIGSTASSVLQGAECDVLVVHTYD